MGTSRSRRRDFLHLFVSVQRRCSHAARKEELVLSLSHYETTPSVNILSRYTNQRFCGHDVRYTGMHLAQAVI